MRTLGFCKHLLDELESPLFQNFRGQASARYLLYSVKETNLPRFNNDLNESLSLLAYQYISLGFDFYFYQETQDGDKCFERAGTILEHLNRDKDHQNEISQYTLLISSLCYYCCGQISKALVMAKLIRNQLTIGRMIKLFMLRKFVELSKVIEEDLLLSEEQSLESDFARCFANVLFFFQHGDFIKLNAALAEIGEIEKNAMWKRDPGLWWVSRLMGFVFQRIKETSLWTHVPKLGDSETVAHQYIHNLYYSHHITELFKTQIDALNVILRGEGAVISLPTSSGKTRIAELAILKALLADSESAVLYLAPFRSLAYEIESGFKSVFDPLNFTVSHLYGNNDFSEYDRIRMNESSVWIATPEKAKAIFRCGGFLKRISLVIVDEGHLISPNERDLANEMFIEELRTKIASSGGQFLVLSAVLPNAKDIAQWLTANDNNYIVNDWKISAQRTGVILKEKNIAHLSWDPENRIFNRNFIVRTKDRRSTCADAAIRLQQAFGSVLVFVPIARSGPGYAEAIYKKIETDNDVDWTDNTGDWERFVLKCGEEDPNGEILKQAKKGVFCHNADLPSNLRLSMERLLRKGKAKYIVSTTTLAQGVNIGVSSVIITSLYNGKNKLKKRDFWNIAGRAGRAFIDTEGRILTYVDMMVEPDKADYNRRLAWDYMGNKTLDLVCSGLLSIFREMLSIFDEAGLSIVQMESILENDEFAALNTEESNIFDKLEYIDDSLLSIILEQDSSLDKLTESVESMLVLQQAGVAEKVRIKRLLMARIRRNMKGVEENKPFLTCTGMPLAAASYLYEHIDEISSILQTFGESYQQLEDILYLADELENIVNSLPSKRIFKLDKSVLDQYRQAWFDGVFIQDKNAREDIEKFYSLSVSWVLNAISGYFSNQVEDTSISDIISRVNSCMRCGLPTYSACRVFMAGIESRQSAKELSSYVEDYCDERTSFLQRLLLEIKDASAFSELTRAWLELLRKEDRVYNERTQRIKQCRLLVHDDNTESILYVCKKNDKFYVRNADYTYVREIDPKGHDLDKAVDKPGVYYYKVDSTRYELVSDNYRFWIVND